MTNATNPEAIDALKAKLEKLCALIDHPATPMHEAAAALDRWMAINAKVLKAERARKACTHRDCIHIADCRVCTACEAVLYA